MTKQKTPPPPPQEKKPQITQAQRRWFWIRTVLITVLMFAFVMWFSYPTRGATALLWAGGLAVLILGYFTWSYFRFYR